MERCIYGALIYVPALIYPSSRLPRCYSTNGNTYGYIGRGTCTLLQRYYYLPIPLLERGDMGIGVTITVTSGLNAST